MADLGSLYYSLHIKDLTQDDINKINAKLQNLGQNIQIDPKAFRTAIDTVAKGNPVDLIIKDDDFQKKIEKAILKAAGKDFDLKPNTSNLRSTVKTALGSSPFEIQIQVMKNQARQAVQNALNQASNITTADALKYQRLMRGENQAALAELNKIKAAHIQARDAAQAHARASVNLGGAMGSNIRVAGELGAAMASLYSVHALKEFLSNVIEIGGELEHQKIALDTIYGDPGKTATLFNQIKGLARQSPFGVMDLTKNIKQLSAYGVAYNEVYDTAKRLADISAATSVDINRLILAFGKTKNRTFLDGLEAKQFAYANIPIYDALSKKLTELEGKFVSVKDVMGRIKKREIGFDMVKEILWDMTDEGGKFYNMQEKLAGSVKTSWKLVRDNIELMFGEIAEGSVGSFLKDLGETLQNATRHWKELATVMSVALGVWGAYRLAILANSTMLGKHNAALLSNKLSQDKASASRALAAASYRSLTREEDATISRKLVLNKLISANILKTNALTTAEIKLAAREGILTKDLAARAIAMGKITPLQARYLINQGLITMSDLRVAVSARKAGLSVRFFGNEVQLASFKFKLLLSSIGNFAKSVGAFLVNPVTLAMAAIGGMVHLWQKNNEEIERAKTLNDEVAKKAEGMSKSITEALSKPYENLSGPQSATVIDEYKNLIKDYATLPEDAIARAIYDKDGKIRSTVDQITYLRQELEKLKNVADALQNDRSLGNAVSASGDGWFKEDGITNLKDWSDAYKTAEATYQKFITKHKDEAKAMVEAAKNASPAYAYAIRDIKNLNEQFMILTHNRNEFIDGWKAAEDAVGGWVTRGGNNLLSSLKFWNPSINLRANQETISRNQALEDVREIAENVKSQMGEIDYATEENTEILRHKFNAILEQWGETSIELKRQAATVFSDVFGGIQIMPDETKEKWIEQVRGTFAKAGDESIDKLVRIIKNDGWDKLSKAEKDLITNMFEDADETIRILSPELFTKTQNWLDQNPLSWRIQFFFSQEGQQLSQAAQDVISKNGGARNLSKSTVDILNEIDKTDSNVYELRNAMQQRRQDAQNRMDAAIKAGLDENYQSYKDAKDEFDKVEKAIQELNWGDLLTKDQKSNKGPNQSKKDTVAEQFKLRFKDLKDAWSEFKKWEKTVGQQAAADIVAQSGLFGQMNADEIPRTVEEYEQAIENLRIELEKSGVQDHAQRESLLNDILKQKLEVNKSKIDEEVTKALSSVEEEFDRVFKSYDLFEKIKKATGNQNLAYTFSFGLDSTQSTDYVELVKEKFQALSEAVKKANPDAMIMDFDLINRNNVNELPEELRKAWAEAVKMIQAYEYKQREFVADMLSEYQSTLEKIEKIDADVQKKVDALRKDPELTQEQKQSLEMKIKIKADYDKFQLSEEYLQFFGGVLELTQSQAEMIGSAIRKHLDEQLQAGTISAKEYYDEIKRIEERIEKVRNVRSNAFTFATSGFSGLSNKAVEENDAKRLAIVQKIQKYEELIDKAKKEGDNGAVMVNESALKAAKAELEVHDEIAKKILNDIKKWEDILAVASIVDNVIQGLANAFSTVVEFADSMGVDTESDGWIDAQGVIDTFQTISSGVKKTIQSLMSGDVGGALEGVVSTLLTPFTIWNKIHDRKLEKDIERSKRAFQDLDNVIAAIENRLEFFLGNSRNLKIDISLDEKKLREMQRKLRTSSSIGDWQTYARESKKYQDRIKAYNEGGALGYERQLMKEQLTELERQKADLEDMKKKDPEAIAELKSQIDEQKQAIKDFAEDMADTIYGINLSDWASQIGNALVDAFSKGEDAAEAFRNTVGDIMRNLVTQMITADIIAPAFQKIEDWLFGSDGQSGAYGRDFFLDENEAGELAQMVLGFESVIGDAQSLYEAINRATGGLLDQEEGSSKTLGAGIASVTEDTADLLASYVNAIRAYCAENNMNFEELINDAMPKLTAIAEAQLNQLTMIAENTRRNMVAAETIQESMAQIYAIMNGLAVTGQYSLKVK